MLIEHMKGCQTNFLQFHQTDVQMKLIAYRYNDSALVSVNKYMHWVDVQCKSERGVSGYLRCEQKVSNKLSRVVQKHFYNFRYKTYDFSELRPIYRAYIHIDGVLN